MNRFESPLSNAATAAIAVESCAAANVVIQFAFPARSQGELEDLFYE